MNPSEQVGRAARGFAVPGDPIEVRPLLGGHIHDSHVVTIGASGRRYLLQRINEEVFHDCDSLMTNITRVIRHVSQRLSDHPDAPAHRCLSLVPATDGRLYLRDEFGLAWRMYYFLEDIVTHPTAPDAARAYEAAKAFGSFQTALIDLPGPRLFETIPAFHDTARRYESLDDAIARDSVGRASEAAKQIDFAHTHRVRASALVKLISTAGVPERIAHNDAKISNVLFDLEGRSWVCVVDLDTVMPGLVLFDFGDMVRSMTCFAAEDETDLSRVEVDLGMFEAVAGGYIESTRSFLSSVEREQLVAAGISITLEQGVRFLTDHLEGDRYYAASRTGHNLDRARAQFKLAESMIRRASEMERIVAGLAET